MDEGLGEVRVKERLLAKVRKDEKTGCWEFTGFRLPRGYGRMSGSSRKAELAHRISWLVHNGAIPEGMLVCHKCDNPPCVNPEHLFLGTFSENFQDMANKGRRRVNTENPKTRGTAHWKAKFTSDQIAEIRRRASEPRKKLAKEFGSSPRYISSIISGRKRRFD